MSSTVLKRDRTVVVDGTDMCEEFPLLYSDFEETVPPLKKVKVEVPAGADKDITNALGPIAYGNGEHVFKFLLFSDDVEAEQRRLEAFIHGRMASYQLNWDAGYTYHGRWEVGEVEHLTEQSELVTLRVDRYPWKVGGRESVVIDAHPTGTYRLEGSKRYANVAVTALADATVTIGGTSYEVHAGTTQLTAQVDGDADVTVTVGDWYYYVDGTDLIVNPIYYTLSGTDVDLDNTVFTIDGTNVEVADIGKQRVTLSFTRRDL